jgi:hypothetical protein
MRDFAELNINEGGRRVLRPAPSDALIAAFQARFNVVLPEEYVRLLRHSNGGHPELDSIHPVGRTDDYRCSVNHFFHLSGDTQSVQSLWHAMEEWRPILGDGSIPFAEDGGGNPFFLDLGAAPPRVCWCTHDEGFRVVPIADSFESFIDGLAIDPDMI